MTRIGAVAVALASVAVVAGCGQSATDKYKSQVNQIGKELRGRESALSNSGGSPTQTLNQLAGFLNTAADKLEKTTPPANAKADNAALVSDMRQLANDATQIAQNPQAGAKLAPKAQQDASAVTSTANKLKSDVGG